MVHLGNNIAKLRGFRRMPQKDIAQRLGLTQQEYSRIESKDLVDDDLLERIAVELDFPSILLKPWMMLKFRTSINRREIKGTFSIMILVLPKRSLNYMSSY
jgi:transcriptional regulator with XRE-family HTH domain